MSKLPYMKKPCTDCPFRKDSSQGWLGAEGMTEILKATSFVCHKTLGDSVRRQCAGHMLIKGDANAFVSMARRLNISVDVKGQDLVFESEEACIKHHTE